MEASELMNTLIGLIASENKMVAHFVGIALVILIFVITIATVLDILKKFKDVASGTLSKLANFPVVTFPKKVKTDDVKKRLKTDKALNDLLEDTIQRHGIDRALLCQFHNGTRAKSGMPFEYIVLTHEACAPGIAPSTIGSERYDVRLFSRVLTPLIMTYQSLEARTEEMTEPIRGFLKENGSKRFVAKVLTDAIDPDYAIGVAIFSKTSDTPFEPGIDKLLARVCDICSGILSTAWGSCEQCARNGVKCKDGCPKPEHIDGRCSLYKPHKDDKEKHE